MPPSPPPPPPSSSSSTRHPLLPLLLLLVLTPPLVFTFPNGFGGTLAHAVYSTVMRVSSLPLWLVRCALWTASEVLVGTAVLYAFLHRIGAVRRIIIWRSEKELSHLANKALITVGDMDVNVIKGRVVATDVIVHAPKREEWVWDSPLVVRIGRVDVRLNILSCVDFVGPMLGFPCKDVHSIVAEDIQVFVEKRRNVFNFHLLDPSLDLPDPEEVLKSMGIVQPTLRMGGGEGGEVAGTDASDGRGREESSDMEGGGGGAVAMAAATGRGASRSARTASLSSLSSSLPPSLPSMSTATAMLFDDAMGEAEAKANEIVTHLVGAVSSVGRAATGGGPNGRESLASALMDQKAGFVGQLKEFQARLGGGGGGIGGGSGIIREDSIYSFDERGLGNGGGSVVGSKSRPQFTKKTSDLELLAKDGVKVIQQMGRVLGKNVIDIKEQVDSFQKPPPKKAGWVGPPANDRFRLGRIVVRDARIFTKDMIGSVAAAATANTTTKAALGASTSSLGGGSRGSGGTSAPGGGGHLTFGGGRPNAPSKPTVAGRRRPASNPSGWAEPIWIRELAVSGAELCPPMTAREDDSGLPELGLKIDRVVDIVMARFLAETAKSNTGRLLNNAFGEVCTWMERKSGVVVGAGKAEQPMRPPLALGYQVR